MVKIIEGCISCGLCEGICPNVFRMGENGIAEVYKQPNDSDNSKVQEAAQDCPVSVIKISE